MLHELQPPEKKAKQLIAVDFDGTIVQHHFPDIGPLMEHAERVLERLSAAGHRLILNTCRENEPKRKYLQEAIEFCNAHGIELRSVNENHPDDEFRVNGGRKVYADMYIDDRNLGGFPGWLVVENLFFGEKDGQICG